MFVSSNSAADLFSYFKGRLIDKFSETEIRQMFRMSIEKKMGIDEQQSLFLDDIRLSESDLLHFKELLNRLLDDEPFQYIIGETYFADLKLNCDSRALIPRHETEELIN